MNELKINKKCVYTDLNDEVVILNVESGEYIELNSSASYIWNFINEFSNYDIVLNELCDHFEEEREILKKDLDNFIQEAVKKGLIES